MILQSQSKLKKLGLNFEFVVKQQKDFAWKASHTIYCIMVLLSLFVDKYTSRNAMRAVIPRCSPEITYTAINAKYLLTNPL